MKTSKILIDLDRLKNPWNGLGQFALKFGTELAKKTYQDLKFTFLVPPKYVGYFGNHVDYEITNWKRRYFPYFLPHYDLWHAIHQDSNFFPVNKRTRYMLTIHDLNFLKEKNQWKAKNRLTRLQKKVNKSCWITTISEFSKNEILEKLKFNVPISVIYNGIDVESPISFNQTSINLKKYLLGLGVILPKKNWKVLIEMMKFLPDDFTLKLAGDKQTEYALHLQKLIHQNQLENKIELLGRITESEKYFLLKDCYAFVFPSKYEGMGMPPIEAMRFGKPVFVFPNTSIPEFCKNFAFYWESEESQYMANYIIEKTKFFYSHPQFAESVIEHSKQFQWELTAEQYLNLYRKILSQF